MARSSSARAVGDVCRRPIEVHERPFLIRLGQRLKALREEGNAPSSLALVGSLSEMQWRHLWRLERGYRRTRPSTLERIARALCTANPDLGDPVSLAEELVGLAGPALAPESEYKDRIDRRRRRRWRKKWATGEWATRSIAHTNGPLQSERSEERPAGGAELA